jgi:soluble lytic murein transglycosylase
LEASASQSAPDDYAFEAVQQLDAMDAAAGAALVTFDQTEELRRASIYYLNRDFKNARRHYQAILENSPQSDSADESLLQIGRAYYQERDFQHAIPCFDRLHREFGSSRLVPDALAFRASSFARIGDLGSAINGYKTLIETAGDTDAGQRALLNLVDLLRDAGHYDEALKWIDVARERFSGRPTDSLALFARARLHMAASDWRSALADLASLKERNHTALVAAPGGPSPAELTFLIALCDEQSGRIDEAVSTYLDVPYGDNGYYGERAEERLRALRANPTARATLVLRFSSLINEAQQSLSAGSSEDARSQAQAALRLSSNSEEQARAIALLRRSYQDLPQFRVATPHLVDTGFLEHSNAIRANSHSEKEAGVSRDLLYLELYDEAIPELVHLRPELMATDSMRNISPNEAYTLAVAFSRAGMADQSIRTVEARFSRLPADFKWVGAPSEWARLLYPRPFTDALLESSGRTAVDPRFVLSIARQESRFRPDAKSGAAARGLMQFIPSTAEDIAKRLGIVSFDQQQLYRPQVAILFGSSYLQELVERFPSMPQAVAASYNGGEDNMQRWISRARSSDPDRYVSEIGFAQSKDYVFKVISNFNMYQQLYDEHLQPR